MKKLKIYLDTSVISYLQAEDVQEKMKITNVLWSNMQKGKYKACISDMVFEEISNCYEDKRRYLLERLADIDFELFEITEETKDLAYKYIKAGAFTEKHIEDALHVASASVNICNAVISWNFKHIVKLTAMLLVNGVRGGIVMNESKVMKELRETRNNISREIKDMNSQQINEYFRNNSQQCLNEIKKIRENRKAI